MYYPKFKIITNLFTNTKEFVIKETNSVYTGFYWKTYDGKFYTGKSPDDSSKELEKIQRTEETENLMNISLPNDSPTPFKETDNFPYDEKLVLSYISSKNININKLPSYKIPSSFIPSPSEKDYQNQEFIRYFVKKINLNQYTEIKKEEYKKIKGKDDSYFWKMYHPFFVNWKIFGIRNEIEEINFKNVDLLKLNGFKEFLDFRFTQYYLYPKKENLKTEGDQLKTKNNLIYRGTYNVDPILGFVDLEGNELFPLNEDIETQILGGILNTNVDYLIKEYKNIKK